MENKITLFNVVVIPYIVVENQANVGAPDMVYNGVRVKNIHRHLISLPHYSPPKNKNLLSNQWKNHILILCEIPKVTLSPLLIHWLMWSENNWWYYFGCTNIIYAVIKCRIAWTFKIIFIKCRCNLYYLYFILHLYTNICKLSFFLYLFHNSAFEGPSNALFKLTPSPTGI